MSEFIEAVTYASAQSDRWIFVALLAIGVLFSTVLFRYFASETGAIRREMREQNTDFISHLKLANKEITELVKTAHEIIGENTSIMQRVERRLERE
jgi:hypothetical protein